MLQDNLLYDYAMRGPQVQSNSMSISMLEL